MKLSLPPALGAALGRLASRLPFLKPKAGSAEPFSSVEDETIEADSLQGPNVLPAASLGPGEGRPSLDLRAVLSSLIANRAFLIGAGAFLCLCLALAVVAFIAGAPPKALPSGGAIAPGGKEALRGLVPPRRVDDELEAGVELERPENAVYTVEDAKALLAETRSRALSVDISRLAARNDEEAAKLYETVP